MGDSAYIANRFGPKGAFITGVVGFITFYFVLPWALVAWAEHNKAKMVGQSADLFRHLLDEVFIRRFIHPSEWVGIAVLIVGAGIALWKLATAEPLSSQGERDASWLAKLIARLLD